jgi:hypothetical protein
VDVSCGVDEVGIVNVDEEVVVEKWMKRFVGEKMSEEGWWSRKQAGKRMKSEGPK